MMLIVIIEDPKFIDPLFLSCSAAMRIWVVVPPVVQFSARIIDQEGIIGVSSFSSSSLLLPLI